ncbi:MAG: hypothetical protein LUD84_04020 [Clostridiales bacterium]|nr:hypothetical protein [Clostridiales bacterium]
MVRVIMGGAGAGKTKQLIDLLNAAVTTEHGNIICIEPNLDLTYNIHHDIRLVAANEYPIRSYEKLQGFLCGLYAGNYDITHIFVDNLCKIAGNKDPAAVEQFLNWLDTFGDQNSIKFTITMSFTPDLATEGIKKYC